MNRRLLQYTNLRYVKREEGAYPETNFNFSTCNYKVSDTLSISRANYREAKVNEILKQFHPDCATLRREMIADNLMQRESGI